MQAFRALVDQRFTTVAAYYRMFSCDETYYTSISIDPRQVTPIALTSFLALLRALRTHAQQGEKHFLLACHGNPNGFPYPLIPGRSTTANADLLDDLRSALDGDAEAKRKLLRYTDNHNVRLYGNERQLDDYLRLVDDVRQAQIEHIEFRACNIGAGPALEAISDLLRPRITAAPKVFFIWLPRSGAGLTTARVSGTPEYLHSHVQTLGPYRRLFSRDECMLPSNATISGTDVAFAIGANTDASGRPSGGGILALGGDAIKGWTQAYLENLVMVVVGQQPAGGGYRRGGVLPIMGFWTPSNAAKPFVFSGDGSDYTGQLEIVFRPTRGAKWAP